MKFVFALGLSLAFSSSASATWFGDVCALFMGRANETPPSELTSSYEALNHQILKSNKLSMQHFAVTQNHAPFLKGEPWVVELKLKLDPEHKWLRPMTVEAFVNPNYVSMDWRDDAHSMNGPALLLMFDNVDVHTAGGHTVKFSDLMLEHAKSIQHHIPSGDVEMKVRAAADFTELNFDPAYRGKTLVWLEGTASNAQLRHWTLLSLQYAVEQSVYDPQLIGPAKISPQDTPAK